MMRLFSITGLGLVLATTAAAPAAAQALRIAPTEAPARLSTPVLQYPEALRRERMEGIVVIGAVVDTTGRVDQRSFAILKSADPRMNEAARAFVAGSIYRPARVNGQAVAMPVKVAVAFRLR